MAVVRSSLLFRNLWFWCWLGHPHGFFQTRMIAKRMVINRMAVNRKPWSRVFLSGKRGRGLPGRSVTALLCGLLAFGAFSAAGFAADKGPLTQLDKFNLIRGLVAEVGLAKTKLPRGKTGVILSAQNGQVLNLKKVRKEILNAPPAAQPGQRIRITALKISGNELQLDINGGPYRPKWYHHLQVGIGGNISAPVTDNIMNSGSQIVLRFPHGIPAHLSAAQVKQDLKPLVEWNLHATAQIIARHQPLIVRHAIKYHQALVGMDRDLVLASMGHPWERDREKDKNGVAYEDWIYGHHPGDITFVRFIGNRVVRITVYKPTGGKIVRDKPEIRVVERDGAEQASVLPGQAGAEAPTAEQQQRPTLKGLGGRSEP